MSWRLELFDNANTTRAGIFALYRDAHAIRELEGEDSLNFTLSQDDSLYASMLERKYVRLGENEDSSNYRSFIVQRLSDIRDETGNLSIRIECEGLKYALMDNIIASKQAYSQITATTALTGALAGSGFTVGTVNPGSTNLNDIEFNFLNSLEAIQLITETWFYDDAGVRRRYYYRVNENKSIDILTLANFGTQREFYIIYDKNLRSMNRERDCQGMANRVYGVGADGFGTIRAGRVDYIYECLDKIATGGAVGYLEDTANINVDDYHNGMQLYIDAGTGSGQKRIISDTVASTHRFIPTVNFSPAPDATSEYIVGYAESGDEMTYDLGLYAADNNEAAVNTDIIVPFTMDAVDASGSATFIIRVQGLDISNNVVMQGSYRKTFADLSVENTASGQIVLHVGSISTIDKVKLICVSCNANGYLIFQHIYYSLGLNAVYAENPASQASYGVVAGKYENPNIQDTLNIVKTPAMDGVYTGGLCENWAETGTPVTTENTNADYITHGTKSQKVVTDAVDEGIQQALVIDADMPYSAFVRIYIDPASAGSVKFLIDPQGGSGSDTYQEISGAGWVEVTIDNFSYDTTDIIIKILSSGEASTFYVDAVMVHKGSEVHEFIDGDSADVLWREANNHLQQHKNPIVSYGLDLLDLYEHDRAKYGEENFLVGDAIRVIDPELSIDIHLTVVRKEFDIDNPQNCKVGLGEKRLTWHKSLISSVIKQIRLTG